MNHTYKTEPVFFAFSNYQFELHMLSLLALTTCLRELLLKDNLKHWLEESQSLRISNISYNKILSFWILENYSNNSMTKIS